MADYGHELAFGTFLTPQNQRPEDVISMYNAGVPWSQGQRIGETFKYFKHFMNTGGLHGPMYTFGKPDGAPPQYTRGVNPWQTPELLYAGDGTLIQPTRASDVGRALLAALDHRDGCQVFTISGDESARLWSIAKARRVLGWAPTAEGAP